MSGDREDEAVGWEWSATAKPPPPVRLPGDEREQAVLLEATARGNRVLLDAMLCLAIVAAWLGGWLVPAALLAIISIAGRVIEDYAQSNDVDYRRLSEQPRPETRSVRRVLRFFAVVLVLAGMSYTGYSGHGLLPDIQVVGTGPEASSLVRSAAGGLPLGAGAWIIGMEVVMAIKRRRRSRSRPDDGGRDT
ncbi:hypothetical protein [Georgenia sp. MJ170]|uniref:hypothetical protein n=1 Tax=Georgenia sunbinii TaxID=3117728 RepID=UPI002F261A24